MASFDDIDAANQAAMDAAFGKAIRLIPQVLGNYGSADDPDRPARDLVGIVSHAPKAVETRMIATRILGANVAVDYSEVWISANALAGLGYSPRRGDIIEFSYLGGDTPPRSTIGAVHPGDFGDAQIILSGAQDA